MNNVIETFEIQTTHNNNNVCKMDPMLFFIAILVFTIFMYIVQFKIN
jgi:hypothetical protein